MWMSTSSAMMSSSESPIQSIAQYIEDYMDLVDNIPNDIARHMTQLHEHNHRYHQLLHQLETSLELVCNESTAESRKRITLLKIQRSLIEIQEIADEKLLLIQAISDQLDTKARQLDFDYRSVTVYNPSANQTNNSRVQIQKIQESVTNTSYSSASQRVEATTSSANTSNTINAVSTAKEESSTKEVPNGNANGVSADNSSGKRASARRNTGSRGNNDNNSDASSKRSVKRGMKSSHKEMKRTKNSLNHSNNSSTSSLLMGNNSPPHLYEGAPIDPDEPTYCLCEQVSFGEMICCDNTDCKIEWFHFACVSLNTKPKGKWFCPNCRGDRSNIQKK